MAGDTVRLYTRQNDKTLLMLEHGGRILNQRVYVQLHFGDMAKHYLDCYDWFAREAAKLVPKPDYAELPIWCAVEAGRCLPPEPGTVVYVVDIPKETTGHRTYPLRTVGATTSTRPCPTSSGTHGHGIRRYSSREIKPRRTYLLTAYILR